MQINSIDLNQQQWYAATHVCCDELGLKKFKKAWTNHCDAGARVEVQQSLQNCCVRKQHMMRLGLLNVAK